MIRFELRAMHLHRLHVQLVFENKRAAKADVFDQLDHAPRFGSVRASGFSQITPFSFAAGL